MEFTLCNKQYVTPRLILTSRVFGTWLLGYGRVGPTMALACCNLRETDGIQRSNLQDETKRQLPSHLSSEARKGGGGLVSTLPHQ